MQKIGGFQRGAKFPQMEGGAEDRGESESGESKDEKFAEGEGDTIMEDEALEPAFLPNLTNASLNAKKQSPYGPQYPALDRYFRAK